MIVDDLRIGVFGYGMRGSLAKHAHRPGSGSAVVAVLDPDPEARQRAATVFGPDCVLAETLSDFLAAELDAAFVLSPDWLHAEHGRALLEAGVAVYLEKPMAISTDDCDQLLATARKLGGKLYLGHNMRHMAFVREMKRLIDDGAIGEPKVAWARHFVGHGGEFYFCDWHAERRRANTLLLQKGAHDIDVLHWLCGAYTVNVSGIGDQMVYRQPEAGEPTGPGKWWTKPEAERLSVFPPTKLTGLNPVVDVEDVSMLNMTLSNGVLASYQQCHFTPDYWRNYTVIGTEGRIENLGNGEPGSVIKLWNRRHEWAPNGDVEIPVVPKGGGMQGHGGADPLIVQEFLRYVRSGGSTDTSPVAARYAVATGCAGADSIRRGGVPVPVPRLDPDVASYFP